MKKILLMLSLLLLAAYGCNRDEVRMDSDMQREERIDPVIENETEFDLQREEVRPLEEDYREDGTRLTQPIDERMDLEEEQ